MNEFEVIENTIQNKIVSYIEKYLQSPNFLKVPYWVYESMKKKFAMLMTRNIRIDYQREVVTYKGLVICPTISIEMLDEIEVF